MYDLVVETLPRFANRRGQALADELLEWRPRLPIARLRMMVARIVVVGHPVELAEQRALPKSRVERRELRHDHRGIRGGTAGDLVADAGRRHVLNQQDELACIQAHVAVVTLRHAQRHMPGHLAVHPDLVLVEAQGDADALRRRLRRRKLRDER